jgi:hypothetical protein
MNCLRCLFLLVLSSVGSPTLTSASEIFRAVLTPRPGVESAASGTAEFVLDGTETEIRYAIEVQDLSSAEIAAHVHRSTGEILFDLPLGASKSGIWQNPGPLAVFLLRSQELFVLVHTEIYPQGEVRGDLLVPVSGVSTSWGAVKALYENRP